MSFIRMGTRLANGARSGAYVFNDGAHLNVMIQARSAKRRKCDMHVKLTVEELCAIAKSVVARGWLDPKNASAEPQEEVPEDGLPQHA